MPVDLERVQKASAAYPKPPGYKPSYGTAGFRTEASKLPSTVFRCGLLIGLRALSTGAACGVMITASHNVDTDNGVKLVDPSGEMLEPAWEDFATILAQAETDADLASVLSKIAAGHPEAGKPGQVIIGRDTRSSGPELFAAAKAGAEAVGASVVDIGVVTTPQLHFAVQSINQYGSYEEHMFFTSLVESYRTLAAGTPAPTQPLHVDCANGVGALKLQEMLPQLKDLGLEVVLYNTGEGRLNHDCGADFVQKEQTFPAGEGGQQEHAGVPWALLGAPPAAAAAAAAAGPPEHGSSITAAARGWASTTMSAVAAV
jgi:phosphoacetylglucosamine mutase